MRAACGYADRSAKEKKIMNIFQKIIKLFKTQKAESLETQKRCNYFFIDESGSIGGNSDLFIHGCIVTDVPNLIEEALNRLKCRISDNAYFEEFYSDFVEHGFHAVENHFDIRAAFYQELVY